ncbi:MAG: PIG-L family deacetylase [Chloroflexia bacterium]|nr:PIG-L family deacetylase [Chloroflexia bacterium]
MVPQTVVCLSPHPDDAVLSCAGLLSWYRERGWDCHVVTVFAGDSPAEPALSPFARQLHLEWGEGERTMAHRRQEDAAALHLLGCRASWWNYLDAIYRHPNYNSQQAIFGQPAEEGALEQELLARCDELPAQILLFPLAVGNHVDHQLVFRVGCHLYQSLENAAPPPRRIAFYEDLPYAAWEGGAGQRLQALDLPLLPQTISLAPYWPLKLQAVSCYASQFSSLNRDGVPVWQALERYASAPLGDEYIERLWWPRGSRWI